MSAAALHAPPALWEALVKDLLSTPELERAAVGFAGFGHRAGGEHRLLLREWEPIRPEDYLVQLGHHLEISPVAWARAAKRARGSGEALVLLHSHPRDRKRPCFSSSDDFGEERLVPKIQARAAVPVASAVLAPGGERGRITLTGGAKAELELRRVGVWPGAGATAASKTERFDRQRRALGSEGQALIAGLQVGVVGMGGLGSHVVQQLLHLGVGGIVVVDPDRVEVSNLSRLVGAGRRDARWRRAKTSIAGRLARRIGAATVVKETRGSVTDRAGAAPLLDCDLVVGCTDNHWSRMILNALAYQYYLPVLDLGVELQRRGAMGARLTWLEPGTPCLWCRGILDPVRVRSEQLPEATAAAEQERGYVEALSEPAPAVISINGVIASLAVSEILARVTGFTGSAPRPQMLLYRLGDGVVRRIGGLPQPGCPTCQDRILGAGDLAPPPWRD